MKRSTQRILTTHTGRLESPSNFADVVKAKNDGDEKRFDELVQVGVTEIIRKQIALGNDIHSNGEFAGARDQKYYDSRFTGIELRPLKPGEPSNLFGSTSNRERHSPEFREFYAIYDKVGNTPGVGAPGANQGRKSVITGPLKYKGQAAIKHELEVTKKAIATAGLKASDVFYPVIAPAWLCHSLWNEYYKTDEEWVYAIAEAWRGEFQAVVEAGFELSIDDPALCTKWVYFNPALTVEEYRKHTMVRIEATNHMLRGIPVDNVRYHTCWGSQHVPHSMDIPFRHVVDLLLKINVPTYSVEAADVQHQLDWKVWQDIKLPEGKVYIPGVVAHKTSTVEPPELVADRLMTYARVMGRENVIAGTDCGYGNRTYPPVGWAKMKATNEGAKLASRELWRT